MVGVMRAVPVAVALLLAASGTGRAWVSSPQAEPAIVVASGAAPRIDRVTAAARTLPAGWQGTIDRDTGVVAQLWGGSISPFSCWKVRLF